jgi:hypothetical protein
MSLLLNEGDRSFARGQQISAGTYVPSLDAGDIDGDGDVDLAACSSSGALFVWENDGTASFPLRRQTATGIGSSAVIVRDLDGDGDLDAATADTTDSRVSTSENKGRGDLVPSAWIRADRPDFLVPVDLDGDGRIDLVTGGPYAARGDVVWNAGRMAFEDAAPLELGLAPRAAEAVDVDRDGDPDLAFLDTSSATLLLLENRRPRSFAGAVAFTLPMEALTLSAGDVDRDGDPDIALGMHGWSVGLLRNVSAPAAASDRNRNSVPDPCEGTLFVRGDPDADGRTSIADALLLLRHLFAGERPPACAASGDADADGRLSTTDAVVILGYLFRRGPRPAEPFPDCDAGAGPEDLGCEEYSPCAG